MTQRQIERYGFFSYVAFPFNENMNVKVYRRNDNTFFQGHEDVFIMLQLKNGITEIFTLQEWTMLTSFVEMSLDMIKPCKKNGFTF